MNHHANNKNWGFKSSFAILDQFVLYLFSQRSWKKIIAEKLADHLERNKIIYPMRFQSVHDIVMANCYLTENIKSVLDRGNVVGAVFLDLQKAFDTVNHKILLNKLNTSNFSKQITGWFTLYLESREQSVKINSKHSTSLKSRMGTP